MTAPATPRPQSAAAAAAAAPVCESCGRRPAAGRVVLGGAEPFAVCADCAPPPPSLPTESPAPPAAAHLDDVGPPLTADDVPPVDWSGVMTIRQPWREVARPVALVVFVPLLAYGTYWFGGRTAGSFLAMVAVGTTVGTLGCWLDWRLLRRSPRWGLHSICR